MSTLTGDINVNKGVTANGGSVSLTTNTSGDINIGELIQATNGNVNLTANGLTSALVIANQIPVNIQTITSGDVVLQSGSGGFQGGNNTITVVWMVA